MVDSGYGPSGTCMHLTPRVCAGCAPREGEGARREGIVDLGGTAADHDALVADARALVDCYPVSAATPGRGSITAHVNALRARIDGAPAIHPNTGEAERERKTSCAVCGRVAAAHELEAANEKVAGWFNDEWDKHRALRAGVQAEAKRLETETPSDVAIHQGPKRDREVIAARLRALLATSAGAALPKTHADLERKLAIARAGFDDLRDQRDRLQGRVRELEWELSHHHDCPSAARVRELEEAEGARDVYTRKADAWCELARVRLAGWEALMADARALVEALDRRGGGDALAPWAAPLAALRARIDGAPVAAAAVDACPKVSPCIKRAGHDGECIPDRTAVGEHPLQARVRELEAEVSKLTEQVCSENADAGKWSSMYWKTREALCRTGDEVARLRAGVQAEAKLHRKRSKCLRTDGLGVSAQWFDEASERLTALLATSAGAEKTGEVRPLERCDVCDGTPQHTRRGLCVYAPGNDDEDHSPGEHKHEKEAT